MLPIHGYESREVAVSLHTPWAGAISCTASVVAPVALGRADTVLEQVIGFIGVALGAGNAVGGYVVTERMLQMFKASGQKSKKESA